MAYDLNDPNLDFDIEQEAIINALKGARKDRRAEAPELTGRTWAPSGSALGGIGAALTRAAGGINESRAMREQRALAGEQQRRFDALQGQLGDLPEDSLAANQQRMQVAQQMSRLPMARSMAEEMFKRGTAFPEKMAELKAKQIEAGEMQAQRLREKEAADLRHAELMRALAAGKNQTAITIAGMPSRSNIGGGDGEKPMTPAQRARQNAAHAKDWTTAAQALEQTYNAATNVDQLLEDPGFDHLFGTTSIVTRQLPQARQAYGKLESLKSSLKAAGLEAMRAGGSIGAMTEKEWPIVEAMISGLDERMSPKEARAQIKLIQERIGRIGRIAQEAYDMQWGDTSYYRDFSTRDPGKDVAPGVSPTGVVPAKGGLSADEQAELERLRAKHGRR